MEFLEACQEFINIDSSPTNGTGELCLFAEKLATQLGFHVHRQEDVQRGLVQSNIICTLDKHKPQTYLMLQTHLDTVDPGSFALWERTGRNPFSASIHNDRIFGLGAADSKLDFLCKIYAAKEFVGRLPQRSFAVVGTFGGETGMQGAISLLRHKVLTPEKIIVGDPTNFNVIFAGKGSANVEITIPFSAEEIECRIHHDTSESQSTQSKIFAGKAAHSTRPEKGVNSLEKLFGYLRQLPDQILVLDIDGGTNYNTIPTQAVLEFDFYPLKENSLNQKIIRIFEMISVLKSEFMKHEDHRFEPAVMTFNLGMARTFSDHFKIMGCVRWPSAITEELYRQWMERLASYCADQGAAFHIRDFKKPFTTTTDSEFTETVVAAVRQINGNCQLTTQPLANEANVFSRFGVETLVFGPGIREDNAQTPQESIMIDDLHKATTIYQNLIQKLCF